MRNTALNCWSRRAHSLAAAVLLVLVATAAPVTSSLAAQADAAYYKLHPDFVVNLSGAGSRHFLLATVQVMTHDPVVIEQIKLHSPALRDALLMLLSGQAYDSVDTPENRKKLQQDALAALNSVMERETGSASLEGLYFTNFVIE